MSAENETAEKKRDYPYLDIYKWTQNLSAEQHTATYDEYLWTPEMKMLRRRLTLTGNNMIAVIGYQGIGKTTARENLRYALMDDGYIAHSLKWRGNESIFEIITNNDRETYQNEVFSYAYKKAKKKMSDNNLSSFDYDIMNIKESNEKFKDYAVFDRSLKELTPREIAKIQYDTIVQVAAKGGITLLIDFPDYYKHNKSQMLKDIARFCEWWDELVSYAEESDTGDTKINIVIFFQKELWGGHFAFGKFDVIEIKPFTPTQITVYYEKMFEGPAPFTEEALIYLAGLARGIIRWFKKYVRVCLEHYYDYIDIKSPLDIINLENVKEWVTVTQLAEDWDRELMELMPKSRGERRKAVELMRYLYEKGATTQREIVDKFFVNDSTGKSQCSRILSKLELYGYLKRTRDGRENKISMVTQNE